MTDVTKDRTPTDEGINSCRECGHDRYHSIVDKIVGVDAYVMDSALEDRSTNSEYTNGKPTKEEEDFVAKQPKEELRSPFEDGNKRIKHKASDEIWTTAAIKDELTFQLSSASSFNIDENSQAIHITHKYYDRADFVLYRINVYKPPTVFIINLSDITPKLQSELEQLYKDSPETFERVVTEAVQSILESINQRYYHVSNIAYKVNWRFEP